MRDITNDPYTKDEARAAEYINTFGVGGGDDPIGFILSSHASLVELLKQAKASVARIENAIDQLIASSAQPEA